MTQKTRLPALFAAAALLAIAVCLVVQVIAWVLAGLLLAMAVRVAGFPFRSR
ncbi:MAG: hypothetical protein JZU64_01165 [Rhodoferax sp.]|jgi:hypothetical protein|nr:hypothetical protein [Rhodoferax sp.]